MEKNCISLRTFILGEIKVYKRDYSPKYEVIFQPNSWAYSNGITAEKCTYYDLADAEIAKDAIKAKYISMFSNQNKD